MLSTSTLTSSQSNFGANTPTTVTTHYSTESSMKSSRHPLVGLLEAETTYLKTLKVIDSQIAPLWMKQTTQTAPDFTELMKHASDIFMVNKRFSQKLKKLVGNAQAPQELGNILMHWVNDMEVPYTNYSRCYIPNLDQRYDILANGPIDNLLKNLSQSTLHDITLETFFDAPIQQLKYYYGLYNRLLHSVEPNRPDFEHLNEATRRLEKILVISEKSSATSVLPSPIHTQLDNSSNTQKVLKTQDDLSYYSGTSEVSPLESLNDDARFDGFGSSLVLDDYDDKVDGNEVKQDSAGTVDDDLFNIQPRSIKILDAIPVTPNVANTAASIAPPTKKDTSTQVQMTFIQPATSKVHILDDEMKNGNQQQGKDDCRPINTPVSIPLAAESTTTMKPAQIETPVSVSAHTTVPSAIPTLSGDIDAARPVVTAPQSQRTLSPVASDSHRPISPRAVQVQQAVTPVAAMQAVSEKTNDYFSNPSTGNPGSPLAAHKDRPTGAVTDLPARSTSSTPGATILPRTSSIKQTTQVINSVNQPAHSSEALYRQSPTMTRSNLPGSPQLQPNQSPIQKPLPAMNNIYNHVPANASSSNHHAPLLRTSSHNSTTQQLQGTASGPHPPRTHSNGSPSTATPVYQQRSPIIPQQSMSTQSPVQSPVYQQRQKPPPMDDQQNNIRQVMYSNNRCEVFHWKDQSWYAVEGQCTLQVRLTFGGRSCLAVQMQTTGQIYLNAWIVPSMVISQPSPTDISISVAIGSQHENYLVHFSHPADASNLLAMLHRMHHESHSQPQSSSSSPPASIHSPQQQQARYARPEPAAVELRDETPSVEDVPQTLKPIFQCKCKLFVQSETSKWNPMGSTAMRISQQLPSQKTHIYIEDDKNKLISSIVRSGNVERLTNKRITFLLANDNEKSSMVYLVQLKDEQTGNKVFDHLKTRNAAQGW